ncbi:MAG: MBL fold metallo-hydrolase [Eubacteriales bacterium]|nr:MBL fold metallo-hydrolase [Eubacteriales bacterium]
MNERIQIIPINAEVTLLNDHNEATCYLVTGTQRALLIDTANGYVDLNALCRELTPLPVTVVNTHGHCDHVFGNLYFEQAYLHPADFALHDAHFTFPEIRKVMRETGLSPATLMPLSIGQTFELGGGHTLEVVPLAGHTPGSIGLLDRKYRLLFSGDGINPHIWMQLPESLTIATLRETLVTLKREHGNEFDALLTGHCRAPEPAATMDALLAGCGELLRDERTADHPYRWHGGTSLAHVYDDDPDHCIVYEESKL